MAVQVGVARLSGLGRACDVVHHLAEYATLVFLLVALVHDQFLQFHPRPQLSQPLLFHFPLLGCPSRLLQQHPRLFESKFLLLKCRPHRLKLIHLRVVTMPLPILPLLLWQVGHHLRYLLELLQILNDILRFLSIVLAYLDDGPFVFFFVHLSPQFHAHFEGGIGVGGETAHELVVGLWVVLFDYEPEHVAVEGLRWEGDCNREGGLGEAGDCAHQHDQLAHTLGPEDCPLDDFLLWSGFPCEAFEMHPQSHHVLDDDPTGVRVDAV